MGHVQDTPVSTKMILNECIIYHMKVHIFSYNLGQFFFSKSRIHILPNYEQMDSKTAIVSGKYYSTRNVIPRVCTKYPTFG